MSASASRPRDVRRQPPLRRWPFVLIALVVLALATIFVLPASMMARFLPAAVRADEFSGSLLHGAAGKISVNARDAGAVEWQVHPLSLLRLAMVVDIHWVKVGFVIDGTVEVARHGAQAHDVHGGGPIADLRDLGLAVGWRGNAKLMIADIKTDFTGLQSVSGDIEAQHLSSDRIADGADLGSYVLRAADGAVAADGSVAATLSDAGGPLEIQAQIRFSPATRTGMLTGTLLARPEASAALRDQLGSLSQLRRADSAGRFPVELEFNF